MTTFGGQILQATEDGSCVIRPGVVTIHEHQISSVDFGAIPSTVDVGDPTTFLCPGFVDTHLHLPQFDSIGAAGLPLLPWLSTTIFPAEMRWNDLDYAKLMISRVLDQCLAVGTTGICAYATVDHQATMAALKAFREAGFGGVIGQVLMDQHAPNELLRPASQLLDELQATLLAFPPSARLAAAVTPRFALSCTPSLLADCGKLANDASAIVQTHLSETIAECEAVVQGCEGNDYVEVYEHADLVTERTLFGHGIHLSESEQERLSAAGSKIAHCPTANSFLGSGTMNRASHLVASLKITLGSDIGAGYERSMVRVGRAMIDAAMRLVGHQSSEREKQAVPTAAEAWHQITTGNANSIGQDKIGRIEPGASADMLVIKPDLPWLPIDEVDQRCPLSTLMFCWDDRWIQRTYLQGSLKFASPGNHG